MKSKKEKSNLTPAQIRKEKNKIITQIQTLCRNDFKKFLKFVFSFPVARMHEEWIHALTHSDFVLIVAPRCSGKTSLISIAYPLWRLGKNPNLRIKLITNKIDLGKSILSAISTAILTNRQYRIVFPHIRPSQSRYWTKSQLYVERDKILKDPSIETYGVLASGAGGRSDLLIFDDVIDNRAVRTKNTMKAIEEAIEGVWMNTLDPKGAQCVYVGTIWDKMDYTSKALRSNRFEAKLFYAIDDDFTPLWPQVWSREALIKKFEDDPIAFNAGFRNRPTPASSLIFHESYFHCNKDWKLKSTLNPPDVEDRIKAKEADVHYYTGLDPSTGKGRDWTVFFTLGCDWKNPRKVWVADIRRMKTTAPDTVRAASKLYDELHPDVIFVEANAYQSTILDWIEELSVTHIPTEPFYTSTWKKDPHVGIKGFANAMRDALIEIPYWEHPVQCECPYCQWKKEMLMFSLDSPPGVPDDCVMAAYMAWRALEASKTTKKGSGIVVFRSS